MASGSAITDAGGAITRENAPVPLPTESAPAESTSSNVRCASCICQSEAHLLCIPFEESAAVRGMLQWPQKDSSAPKGRPQTRQLSPGAACIVCAIASSTLRPSLSADPLKSAASAGESSLAVDPC